MEEAAGKLYPVFDFMQVEVAVFTAAAPN